MLPLRLVYFLERRSLVFAFEICDFCSNIKFCMYSKLLQGISFHIEVIPSYVKNSYFQKIHLKKEKQGREEMFFLFCSRI